MSSLNKKSNAITAGVKKANHEGSVQYVKPPKQQLLELAVMTLWGKDSFYETNDDRFLRIEELTETIVKSGDVDFVANVIKYARDTMHIRSVPIIIAVVLAKVLRQQDVKFPLLRQVICDTIQRADQITDMLAVAVKVFGDKKHMPMPIKRGIADAFNKFNEYQFAKWNRSHAVKLKDVLRIVHPKPCTPEQGAIFKRITSDQLTTPETWEVLFSANGKLPEAEQKPNAEIWASLIDNNKLGYQAMLMNIRNMLNNKVDADTLKKVAVRLADAKQIDKSKMLPFQFVAAYNAILHNTANVSNYNLMLNAISDAIDISLTNIRVVGEAIIIIVDLSYSMCKYENASRYNSNGYADNVGTPATIAALFASAIYKANASAPNIAVVGFSDNANFVKINARDSVITIKNAIIDQTKAGGTNLHGAFEFIKANVKFEPDTVILLSDMQMQDITHYTRAYVSKELDVQTYFKNSDCLKIAVNLDSYEVTPAPAFKGWIQLCGWSPRIFDVIAEMRESNIKNSIKLLSGPYEPITIKSKSDKPKLVDLDKQ